MPLFNGRKWSDYPAYPYRHDFVHKPAPAASAPQAVGLDQRILYVPAGKKLLRNKLFFTAFIHYEEDDDVRRVCTREDLCAAFERLVSIFQELHNAGRMLDELPKLEPQLGARLTALKQRLAEARLRALWAAELFGQYLSFLSDCEDAGRLPKDRWRPFPSDPDATHTSQQAMEVVDGQIDDYAFRVAAAVNRRKHRGQPAYVAELKAQIDTLLADILRSTGADAPKPKSSKHIKYGALPAGKTANRSATIYA